MVIEVPADVLSLRYGVAFVPLNWTEIVILGGIDKSNRSLHGDVVTFNTNTCVFKNQVEGEKFISFHSHGN